MKRIFSFLLLMVIMLSLIPVNKAEAASDDLKIYSLVVDRFMNGDESNNKHIHNSKDDNLPYGGDFKGIGSKLDYIKDMGFNTIHLSPVFLHETNDYLGYKVKTYGKVDPVYGSEKEFKALISKIHQKKMKIIIDMPVTLTDEYTPLQNPILNQIQTKYFKGQQFIDLKSPDNQEKYKNMSEKFVSDYNIDGLSMYAIQEGLDVSNVLPQDKLKIAVLNEDIDVKGFDYVQTTGDTKNLQNAFKTVDQEIPSKYENNRLLSADNFFSERFTKFAADENMFPGTRIKQLMAYLMVQKHPVSMTYGTEIAMNGEAMPMIHQLLDFRTEKEVTDYIENTTKVFHQYKEMFSGDMKTIYNKGGVQVIKFDTNAVDFLYLVNDSSKSSNVILKDSDIPDNKMLSGLLIGDRITAKDGKYHLITNREETELYAVVKDRGLNYGYIIAAVTIVSLFTLFIVLVAKRSKRQRTDI